MGRLGHNRERAHTKGGKGELRDIVNEFPTPASNMGVNPTIIIPEVLLQPNLIGCEQFKHWNGGPFERATADALLSMWILRWLQPYAAQSDC